MSCESLKGKKLLILAGNDVHMKLVTAARELGVYTIVTDYLPVEQSPTKLIADEYWMLSTNDTSAVVEKCKQEKVDGVIDFCIDTVQKHYQQISESLGTPCFASAELFDIFTNKRKFKSYCKEYGVDVIEEYSESDLVNGKVKFPILVKPSDSRGSRGITVCHSLADVENALSIAKSESKDGVALVERYMYGKDDMSVVYMVIGGEPYLVKLGDRYVGKVEDGLQCQQMATMLPSKHADQFLRDVEPNIKKMIKSTGVQFGVFFMQGFWEDGRVYMYDPGLRFPGSDFDIVTKEVTGFDSMKAFVEYAVTGNVKACYGNPKSAFGYNGGICLILSISCSPGIIGSIEGFDIVKNAAEVRSARQIYKEGESIPDTKDVRQRVAEFIAYFKDRIDACDFVKWVYSTLQIKNADGVDMIVSKVNINK